MMTFTYDTSTDAGRVRLLISDTDENRQIFQDEEIAAFLSMVGGSVMLAAAMALDTIASDAALTQQAVTILGLATDGPAVAKELRARAAQLRQDADSMSTDAPAFGSASFADDALQAEETYWKTLMREGLL